MFFEFLGCDSIALQGWLQQDFLFGVTSALVAERGRAVCNHVLGRMMIA